MVREYQIPDHLFAEGAANETVILPIAEHRQRRLTWQPGPLVCLADGVLWHLPRISLALLVTTPRLQAELIKAFELADDVQLRPDGSKEYALALMVYHAQMANIGVQLLQVNYDLPDEEWKCLLTFNELAEMLRLTLKVSREIAEAVPVWMPLCLTSGPDGLENLVLN